MELGRAYALLHVKSLDDERRILRGIASTPTPDRNGDILDPLGVTFAASVPLLLHHDPKLPVGSVRFAPPTAAGIEFEAELPIVLEAGAVKDRVDEAWHSIKAVPRLITGVSVGYRALGGLGDGIEIIKKTGGLRFKRTELCELSLVTIPANAEATILMVKAASGLHRSGDTDPFATLRARGAPAMTHQETIKLWQDRRLETSNKATALMLAANQAGVTLTEDQSAEFDGYQAELGAIDRHIAQCEALQKASLAAAVPVVPNGPIVRPSSVVTVRPNVEKGEHFVRAACALYLAGGNHQAAIQYAEQRYKDDPAVALFLKAAVAPGTTTDSVWAGPLVPTSVTSNEFLELLRPKTLLGRLPGLRRAPFNAEVPAQTGGGSYSWVGQGAPKPVTSLAFAKVKLDMTKIAAIIALTEELARLSSPDALGIVRDSMIAGIATFMDQQFVDPTVALSLGVHPGSITNGTTPITATADPVADLKALVAALTAAGYPLSECVFLLSEVNAFTFATKTNAMGAPAFPGMAATGGSIYGIPAFASQTMGTNIVLAHTPSILYADDGGVSIDVSREASLVMDSAPPAVQDPATTVFVSLWQNNLVGVRAERFVNWIRARTSAVKYVSGTAYTLAAEGAAA